MKIFSYEVKIFTVTFDQVKAVLLSTINLCVCVYIYIYTHTQINLPLTI